MATIADIIAEVESCPGGCPDLTEEQIHALYNFKFRLIAALHRTYMQVPESRADQIIGTLWKQVGDRLT